MNAVAAFQALLKDQSAIAALVSTRVYVKKHSGAKSNFPCIFLTRTPAGGSDPYLPIHTARIDVRCYGASQPVAESVYQAVLALNGTNGMTVGSYYFYAINEMSGPMDLNEQVTEAESWDCVYAVYEVSVGAL